MAMVVIFVNAGFAVINQIGSFGAEITERAGIWASLTWLSTPVFIIPLINLEVTGILALSTAIALATVVVLNTNVITDRGVAVAAFALIFYGSVFLTGATIFANYDLPGLEIFYTIYILGCTLIFLMAVVQMPTGGQKTHV
jgi:hypothetical protein